MSEMYGGKRRGSRKGSKKGSRKQKGGMVITNPSLVGKASAGEPINTYNPKLNNNRPLNDWCNEKVGRWGDECWLPSKRVWVKYEQDGKRNPELMLGEVCPTQCEPLRGSNRLGNIIPAGTIKQRSAELAGKLNLKPVGMSVGPMRTLINYAKAQKAAKAASSVMKGGKRRSKKASKKASKKVSKKASKKGSKKAMKGGKKASRKASKKVSKKGSKKSRKVSHK